MNADSYIEQGDACLKSGDLTGAVENCTKAIELGTGHEMVYYNRGQVYAVQGFYQEAIADLEQFLKLKSSRRFTSLIKEEIEALRMPSIKVYLAQVTETNLKSCLCGTAGTVTPLYSTTVQIKDGAITFETTELHIKDSLITVYFNTETKEVITTGYCLLGN